LSGKTLEQLRQELQALEELKRLVSPERRLRMERMISEIQRQLAMADDLSAGGAGDEPLQQEPT
jgi:hypothetical protein